MTIEQLKQDVINALGSVDKDKLSLGELKMYVEILRDVSNISTKDYDNYWEAIIDAMKENIATPWPKPPVLAEMK